MYPTYYPKAVKPPKSVATKASKPLPANCQQLRDLIPALSAKDQGFASSLLANIARYGSATPKQDYWVGKLIERATAAALGEPEPEKVVGAVGNFAKMYALFAKAKASGLKFPKLRLQTGNYPVALSVAGAKSAKPGVINITDGGPFGSNKWYGRVQEDGSWELPNKEYPEIADIAKLLQKLGDAPEQTAAEYGALTGYCCFCNRKLEDEKSTAVGFGPVCAEKWGLKANWKGAKGLFSGKIAQQKQLEAA